LRGRYRAGRNAHLNAAATRITTTRTMAYLAIIGAMVLLVSGIEITPFGGGSRLYCSA